MLDSFRIIARKIKSATLDPDSITKDEIKNIKYNEYLRIARHSFYSCMDYYSSENYIEEKHKEKSIPCSFSKKKKLHGTILLFIIAKKKKYDFF